jgi:hypothetical protein
MFPSDLCDRSGSEQTAQPPSVLKSNLAVGDAPGIALARFLELRGRHIVKGCGALWYAAPSRFLMSLPYQSMLNPNPDELREMIRQAGAFGARFPSMKWTGVPSGLYLLHRRPYNSSSLHIKHRPRVRHGQQCFEVRLAEKQHLLDQGLELNLSTMGRQDRYDPEFGDPKKWERLVESAFACPEISCPAAFRGRRLAAFMITCRERNWLHILHQMSRQDELPNFPNHLLTYTVTAQAFADPLLEVICYGYAPLFAAEGLHEYKLRFGYELVPHRSAIQLHPVLDAILNRSIVRSAVRLARRCQPGSQRIETLETVLEGARASGPC